MKVKLLIVCGITSHACALTPWIPTGQPLVPLPSPGDMVLLPHYPPGHPLPSYENLIQETNFLVSMSNRLRMPNWVAEKFEGSRITRGVTLASLIPQDAQLRLGDWLRLEQFAADLVKDQPDRAVFSLSGPLWLPEYDQATGKRMVKYPVIGDNDIPVPTHLFKILKLTYQGESIGSSGFIIPNIPLSTQRSIADYQVDLAQIEKAAGLNLKGMRCKTNLCSAVMTAAESSADIPLVWKFTWRIKIARSIEEIRKLVIDAIKQQMFTRSNGELVRTTRKRLLDLTESEHEDDIAAILFDESNHSYTVAKAAFESLELQSIALTKVAKSKKSIVDDFRDIFGISKPDGVVDPPDEKVVEDLKDLLNSQPPTADTSTELDLEAMAEDEALEAASEAGAVSDGPAEAIGEAKVKGEEIESSDESSNNHEESPEEEQETVRVAIKTNPNLLERLRALGAVREDESPESVLLEVRKSDLTEILKSLGLKLPPSNGTASLSMKDLLGGVDV